MQCATVLYPNKEDGRFDFEYYTSKHVPMAARLLGGNIEVRKGISSPGGAPAAFVCVATIWIESIDQFQAAIAKNGTQVMGDIPNYTNIQPIIQLDEVLVQAKGASR